VSPASSSGAKITRADIESKFREVQTELTTGAEAARNKVVVAGGVLFVVLVLLSYLLGRRGGRKRSTIVEIRRL
jgi:hypothetical protein